VFNEFSESYLDIELRCWTADFALRVGIRSDIRGAIEKAFKEKIEIPFLQGYLHFSPLFFLN
jgi:small-conductance mechanosensitive channel